MSTTYPQETMGTTLVDVTAGGERRRVFAHRRGRCLEVGEFTRGPLTQELYDAPVHHHCIHVREDNVPVLPPGEYFAHGNKFLSDYMDELDIRGVPYGYLNGIVGKYVSYRPSTRGT